MNATVSLDMKGMDSHVQVGRSSGMIIHSYAEQQGQCEVNIREYSTLFRYRVYIHHESGQL